MSGASLRLLFQPSLDMRDPRFFPSIKAVQGAAVEQERDKIHGSDDNRHPYGPTDKILPLKTEAGSAVTNIPKQSIGQPQGMAGGENDSLSPSL